ncbi:12230_t:CDS:2 [Entrophospora sp. SA101]|nr:12230_t:CDS:2 [Entrophospora sp. SA101]
MKVEVAKDLTLGNVTKYINDKVKLVTMIHDMICKIFLAVPSCNKNKLPDIKVYGIIISKLQFELYPQLYILCKISTFELPKTKFGFSSLNDAMKSFIRLCVLMNQNLYNNGQALNKEQEGDFICKSPMKR